MMNSHRQGSRANSAGDTAISRRSVLAAGGIVAFGGLSGCLDRVASAATDTGASPATVFAGRSGDGNATTLSDPRVSRLTPSLSVGSDAVSREVELEGWVTSLSVMAQNHNSSRSNRTSGIRASDTDGDVDSDGDGVDDEAEGSRANYNNTRSNRSTIARPPDILGDGLDERDETFRVVSGLDAELLEETETAWRSISKRSARTGRNPELDREVSAALGAMAEMLSEMRTELERCSDDVCSVALENVAAREADVRRAQEYAAEGEWAAFGVTDEDAAILTGEYLGPPIIFDAPFLSTLGERAALFRYLDGVTMLGDGSDTTESGTDGEDETVCEVDCGMRGVAPPDLTDGPVIAERFTVCLPDAEVPAGNGSIREAVTPQRFLDYMTRDPDDVLIDGVPLVFDFGAAPDTDDDGDGIIDCDDADESVRQGGDDGKFCGNVEHFLADVSAPKATGGSLESSRASDGTVTVVNTPPTADDGASVLVCPVDGEAYEPDDLSQWGRAPKDVPTTMSAQGRLISQAMVQPPGCPHAFPALFYVGRVKSDGQIVYSGGWVIDDAALYTDSLTVLTTTGETPMVPVDVGDLDGDGFGDVASRVASDERARRGARIDTGTTESLVESGVLSERMVESDDILRRKRPGRRSDDGGGEGRVALTHLALDAPVLHVVNAENASNEVKFKAGAELSKSVN